jgi:prepilin-type N-terminal cleavage/methylation domain-containing protein
MISDRISNRTEGVQLTYAQRRAFTLIELLVTVSIIALLAGFTISGVMGARSAIARMACANNLRQIGSALSEFETANGRFPGVFCGFATARSRDGAPRAVASYSPSSLIAAWIDGQALADVVPIAQTALPLDPDWLASDIASPAALRCPADDLAVGAASSYRYCRGIFPVWPEDPLGTFVRYNPGFRAADITDGLSQTAFCSERLISNPAESLHQLARGVLVFDVQTTPDISIACWEANASGDAVQRYPWSSEPVGTSWMSGRWLHASYYHLFPPNSQWYDCRESGIVALAATSARSNHPNGVNMLCGDGAVKFVRNGIDLQLWRGLATRGGGEIVEEQE